jgi:hypothetical protein
MKGMCSALPEQETEHPARDPLFAAATRASESLGPVARGRVIAASVLAPHADPDSLTWLSGREWNDLAAYVHSLEGNDDQRTT